jgi:hypothetical protein
MARLRYHAKPRKQHLTFNGKLIGCTDTVAAMLVDAATLGGCLVTEADIRDLSNETHPDPASPGLNLGQIKAVMVKLHIGFTARIGGTRAEWANALTSNHRILLQIWYSGIGGTDIGHAVYCEQVSGDRVRIVDPMKGIYSWVLRADLWHAAEMFAQKAGVQSGMMWGETRRTPFISSDQSPDPS